MKSVLLKATQALYVACRPAIFKLTNCETIHEQAVGVGQFLGRSPMLKAMVSGAWRISDHSLSQTLNGIEFQNPIGLAAGFDYHCKLTQILPSIGFGFGTVGTITNMPYGGNPKPMLARLPKSQSLLVNKGFKNDGINAALAHLRGEHFAIPIGISIGKTNTVEITTQAQSVADVVSAFTAAKNSDVPFSYYEMNISCPNLAGNIEFYAPEHLEELLAALDALNLTKPVFIKMPITKTDSETLGMLSVISKHKITGVIFGNLWQDRTSPDFDQTEIKAATKGHFSGKPTEKRSNQLIKLAYQNYGSKLTIIGCGGVFNAEDAYAKIKLGASLVQLVTGLIYRGPQVPGNINLGLLKLLKRDGYTNISQAVGVESR